MLFPASISCFLEAAKQQNITRAAENLFMSRQAVSKQILRLEGEIGVELFDRSGGQLAITAAGRMYFEFFSATLDRWKALQSDVRALSEQDRLVRIGFLRGINIEEQIFSLIDECSRDESGLRFVWERLETIELMERLLSGRLDIIFSFEPELHDEEIDKMPFIESEFCVVIGETHPREKEIKQLSDFEKCTFVTWALGNMPENASTTGFANLCASCGIRARHIVRLPNMDSVQTAVDMGSGVTICSLHDRLCSLPRVKAFPTGIRSDIEIAWRRDEPNPVISELVEKMRKVLNS